MGYERLADEMGVKVVDGIPPNGWWGCYDPDTHTVVRLKTLAPLQKRSSTYHELGHAFFRHVGCNPRQEAQASMWAARKLITPSAFLAAHQISDDVFTIAFHLEVMPRDVRYYLKSLSSSEVESFRKRIELGAA